MPDRDSFLQESGSADHIQEPSVRGVHLIWIRDADFSSKVTNFLPPNLWIERAFPQLTRKMTHYV